MLTNRQIEEVSKRMGIPLVFCDFKDRLERHKLQLNKGYIINLQDEFNPQTGEQDQGTHWTAFQCNEKGCYYFDSFGMPCPEVVKRFIHRFNPELKIIYNEVDIQSLMSDVCGWYCMAFLYAINNERMSTGDLVYDGDHFIMMFNDLDKTHDFKFNHYVLLNFFRSSDPDKRTPIDLTDKN